MLMTFIIFLSPFWITSNTNGKSTCIYFRLFFLCLIFFYLCFNNQNQLFCIITKFGQYSFYLVIPQFVLQSVTRAISKEVRLLKLLHIENEYYSLVIAFNILYVVYYTINCNLSHPTYSMLLLLTLIANPDYGRIKYKGHSRRTLVWNSICFYISAVAR